MNNHNHNNQRMPAPDSKQPQDFTPLIIIFITISLFVLGRQAYLGYDFDRAMYDFMGAFFLIFGTLKVIKLADFVEAYSTYDIIAQKSRLYACIYPFIEITLGVMYLGEFLPTVANSVTLVLMVISSIGVMRALREKKPIECACLGTVFKVPMTSVTLIEDILMALMALVMLIKSLVF